MGKYCKIIPITLAICMAGVFFSCENSLETIRNITKEDTLAALQADKSAHGKIWRQRCLYRFSGGF